MNYIELINQFWRSHEEHSFSTTEIALYVHLLDICNSCHWKNPFKRRNNKIEADLNISYNTLKNARNRLVQFNLISFKSQNGNSNVAYSLSNFDEVANEVYSEVYNEVCNEVLSDTNINKTEKKTETNKKNKKEFDFSFIDEAFKQSLLEWLDYKRGKGQTYKTQKSLETCYKKLLDDSENDATKAAEIIKSAIGNNYSGFFKLNEKGGNYGAGRRINESSKKGTMCGITE